MTNQEIINVAKYNYARIGDKIKNRQIKIEKLNIEIEILQAESCYWDRFVDELEQHFNQEENDKTRTT